MADYRVTVGVFVEDESLENLKSQIRGLKTEKVKVTADTESVKKKLSTVKKMLKEFKTPNKINLTISTKSVLSKISTVQKALNKLKKTKITLDTSGGSTKNGGKQNVNNTQNNITPKNNTAGVEKDLRRIKRAYKEIANLTSKKMKLNGITNTAEIAEMEAQLERAKTKVISLRSSLETKMGASNFATAMGDDFEKAINKIALAEAKVDDAKQKAYAKINTGYSGSANLSKMFDIDNKISKLGTVNQTTTASVEKLRVAYANLGTALQSGNVESAIAAQKRFEDALEETNYAIKKNQALNKNAVSAQSLDIGRQKLGNDIDMWFKNNSAAAREFGAQIESLKARLKTCDNVELNNLRSEFNKLKTDAQLAGKTGMSFADNMKAQFSKLGTYMAASMGIMEMIMLMRNMFDNVLKVDTALTELYRVTDLTASGYDDLYGNMTASAKEYGVVLSDLIASTAAWARLGFDANVANEMAEISAMYQHIADIDYDTAVENLVTGFKGFEDQLGQMFGDDDAAAMEYIADIYNEIGNNFAIGSDQVGDSLTRAASALSIAGNTIEQSAGMVTAVTEVTQDPEKAGSAMKILSLRLRGMKGELEDMGEPIDENVEDISKMQQQVYNMTGQKVNIFDDTGNFKSTYDIMQEIAAVWDDLNSVQQADLLETIAGKNRANDVAALINNWEQAEAAAGMAENASGSASREHLKYMDSLQGRIETFKATWQVLSNTLVDSDFLKGAVSGATSFLNVLDEIVSTIGILPALLGAVAGGLAMFKTFQRNKNGDMGMGFNLKKDQFGNNVGMQFGKVGAKEFVKNNALIKSYNAGYTQGFKFDPSFQKQVDTDRAALQRLNDAMKQTNSRVMSFKEIESHMAGASKEAVNYAKYNQKNLLDQKNMDSKLAPAQRMAQVATQAQDKSLKNVGRLMKEYASGCKTAGVSQQQFAQAVGQSNPVLGKYLTSLQQSGKTITSASAGFKGYIGSLVKTKAASVALQGATMALNGALSLAGGVLATMVMSAAISGIMKLVNAEQELADKVDEVTAKYNDQKKALGDTGNFETLASRYSELSVGVSGTGMNMTLSTAEYEEYKQVVSELADLMPELVSGYNAEGVAILNCAGSYDALNEARKQAIIDNSNEIMKEESDIFKDFTGVKADAWDAGFFGGKFNMGAAQELKEVLSGEEEDMISAVEEWDSATQKRVLNAFEDADIDISEGSTPAEQIQNALQNEPERCKEVYEDFYADLEAELSGMKSLADAHISKAFAQGEDNNILDGFNFGEEMQSTINSAIGTLDYDFYEQFNTLDEMYAELDNIMTKFAELDQNLLPDSFDMLTEFNAGNVDLGSYYDQVEKVVDEMEKLDFDEATMNAVKDMLNIEEVMSTFEDITADLNDMESLTDLSGFKSVEEYVRQLSGSEAAALQVVLETDVDYKSIEELDKAIRNETLLDPVKVDIVAETETLEKVNTAMQENTSASGLSAESIAALETKFAGLAAKGYDVSKMFENTANGVHLNADAYKELDEAYNLENMYEMEQKLADLGERHAELTKEIEDGKAAGIDTSQLEMDRDTIAQLYDETEQLMSQYEGLTSAYNAWQTAESDGDNRDIYANIGKARETIKEELSRGWLDDGTKAYLDLIYGDNYLKQNGQTKALTTASDYLDAWDKLDNKIKTKSGKTLSWSINDFFTVDDEGNETSQGIDNFFSAVNEALGDNYAKLNEAGTEWTFDFGFGGATNDKIAEELGMSAEAVESILRAALDAGYYINFDPATASMEDLEKSANNAKEAVKGIGAEKITFDVDASNAEQTLEDIKKKREEIEKGGVTEDEQTQLDYIEAQENQVIKNKLDKENQKRTFMQLDSSEVEADMREPLQLLQDYQDKVDEVSSLELKGADTSSIQAAQKEADELANKILEMDEDTKLKLGIEPTDDIETIKQKIADGEVQIPAAIDLAIETNDILYEILKQLSLITGQPIPAELQVEFEPEPTEDPVPAPDANVEDPEPTTVTQDVETDTNVTSDENTESEIQGAVKQSLPERVDASVQTEVRPEVQVPEGTTLPTLGEILGWIGLGGGEDGEVKTDPVTVTVPTETKVEQTGDTPELSTDGITSGNVTRNITINTTVTGQDKVKSLQESVDKLPKSKKPNIAASVSGTKKANTLKEAIKNIPKSKKSKVSASVSGTKKAENLKKAIKDIPKTKNVTIDASVSGKDKAVALKDAIKNLTSKQVNVTANVTGHNNAKTLKEAIKGIVGKAVSIVANVSGTGLVNALKKAIAGLKGKTVKVKADVSGTSNVNSLKSAISGLSSKSVTITASVNGYSRISSLKTTWDSIRSKTVTLTTKKSGSGGSDAAGTAHVSGNAFANGKWGVGGSGVALGGELGQELVVRDGRFFTIGDNGAEFFRYKKNDIIFNAAQTESLFRYGGIKGAKPRGKMLATGTAFVEGNAFGPGSNGGGLRPGQITGAVPSGAGTGGTSGTTDDKITGSDDKKNKTEEKEFKETFDWIEIKIEKLEKALEKLSNTAENTFKTWANRNNALTKSIKKTRSEIQILRSAYNRYMKEANKITFSKWDSKKKKWVYDKAYDQQMKKNLQEGKIDISTITNETRANKMQEYKDWHDKAQDVLDKIDEESQALAEKYVQKFDNTITQFEGKLARVEYAISMLEASISLEEAKGNNVSTAYYKALQRKEKDRQAKLAAQEKQMLKDLESAVRSGSVQIGSEEWQRMVNDINDVRQEIKDSEVQWEEYAKTIRELKWESFDNLLGKIDRITQETEFLRDLMSSEKLFDEDTGELTDAGMATMGTHAQDYNTHMEKAALLKKQINDMGPVDKLTDEEIERRNELIDSYQDELLAAKDSKEAIRDMVEEGIQYELDALQERIDKYTEALKSQKDLYDYQKKVKKQTQEIANIEKQMAVYSGDESEEARQKLQKLQVQLDDAKESLEETEYDKYMSGQEELLDDMYTEYEELLNKRLDNIDELVGDVIEQVNASADTISNTIKSAASAVGYTISSAVAGTWDGKAPAVGDYTNGTADGATGASGAVGDTKADHDANDPTNSSSDAYRQAQKDAAPPPDAANSPEATNAKQGDGKVQVNDMVTLKKGTGVYSTATGKTKDGKKSSKKQTTSKKKEGLFITSIAKDAKGNLKAFPYLLSYKRDRSTGDLGWVRRFARDSKGKKTRENFTGYETGAKEILQNEAAWTQEDGREFIVRPSDGAILTPLAKGDSVLNASASSNIWDMANDPAQFIKENLGVDANGTPVVSSVCSTYTQVIEDVSLVFPSVKNYDEMLAQMQRDPNFERLLMSMTFDQIVGKSALGVKKSIR